MRKVPISQTVRLRGACDHFMHELRVRDLSEARDATQPAAVQGGVAGGRHIVRSVCTDVHTLFGARACRTMFTVVRRFMCRRREAF